MSKAGLLSHPDEQTKANEEGKMEKAIALLELFKEVENSEIDFDADMVAIKNVLQKISSTIGENVGMKECICLALSAQASIILGNFDE